MYASIETGEVKGERRLNQTEVREKIDRKRVKTEAFREVEGEEKRTEGKEVGIEVNKEKKEGKEEKEEIECKMGEKMNEKRKE